MNIVAIENGGDVIDFVKPDYTFRADDVLIVSGKKDGLRRLSELAAN